MGTSKMLIVTRSLRKLPLLGIAIILTIPVIAAPFGTKSARQENNQEKQEREAKRKAELDQTERELLDRVKEERELSPEEREAFEKRMHAARVQRMVELAKIAKVTMDQAIQTATSQQQGTVMECSLIAERGTAMYRVTIVTGDESNLATTLVLINAVDGSVVKTFKVGEDTLTVRFNGELHSLAVTKRP